MARIFVGLKRTGKDESKVYTVWKGNFEVLEDGLGLPFVIYGGTDSRVTVIYNHNEMCYSIHVEGDKI